MAFHQMNWVTDTSEVKSLKDRYRCAIGQQYRDLAFIKDSAVVHLSCWQSKIRGIYTCGMGVAHSYDDVTRIVITAHSMNYIQYSLTV